ncbi:DNA-3-methyladenine glycosylase I [Aerococcus sp. UMB1112A]|uniref:DNA-3-methyladenine glycosylase I n=1 Tax=Aerococcus sp. UMB1112A TaxID=3050609 RepID=UPI002551AD23|nr:DNA-3-methyladenine glycosylase I [Aerococcus sp. UMB1112A]MDK8503331.1 DNA-3-methyladenine glycosylase I [Aerococcus sp. UMB1112A]
MTARCSWATTPELIAYHDQIWGRPTQDDQALFKALSLEIMQGGLSWETVLKKADDFDSAYDGFDYCKIARYDRYKYQGLLQDSRLIRNRRKIQAIIHNAQVLLDRLEDGQTFADYLWDLINDAKKQSDSNDAMSQKVLKAMKKDGFSYIGPATMTAFLEAIGAFNPHQANCDLA